MVNRRTQSVKKNPSLDKVFEHLENSGFPLYPYQKEGVTWMLKNELKGLPIPEGRVKGGLLCDEPGLGKTIQTCATMYGNRVPHTLLIVPGAVIHQWVNAIKQILPDFKIYLHHGSDRCRTNRELRNENADVVVTTLGMIYNRKGEPKTILHTFGHWDRIVIDEIHYIRNSASKTSTMASELRSHIKWGLTGTPVQNGERDIFSLYKFLGVPKNILTFRV